MAGKSYNMTEMKTIVSYLTEHKLYGEIRGRKMWIDFANTKLTTRTWQSLKETFLKRILPDLHNPYFNLSIEQINSFRTGYDVSEKNKNKLEIHTVSDDSNDNDQNVPTVSNNDYGIKEEILAGENKKCSKITTQNRSSADTVIVDTCYETAEDIQKDLESPRPNIETKSLRDCITYFEPLTPMLQEVLDDFQSDPENEPEASDRENQIDTAENTKDSENTIENNSATVENNDKPALEADDVSKNVDHAVTSVEETNTNHEGNPQNNIQSTPLVDSDVVCLDDLPPSANETTELSIVKNQADKAAPEVTEPESKDVSTNKDAENKEIIAVHDSNSEKVQPEGAMNWSNSTTDASLPNNPEALNKRLSDENKTSKEVVPQPPNKANNKISRKRSNSSDTASNKLIKKTKLNRKQNKDNAENESKTLEVIGENPEKVVVLKDHIKDGNNKTEQSNQSKEDAIETHLTHIVNGVNNTNSKTDNEQTSNFNQVSEITNPCLQNVSLFDEQFKLKCSTTESEDDAKKNKKIANYVNDKIGENKVENKMLGEQNEVVMLKSHSDTEESRNPPKQKYGAGLKSSKRDRERALANVFGFSSGAISSKRKRQLSRRKRTTSHNNNSQIGGSNSSEWTSENESEAYVSPPRSRKNRPSRKYLKPKSARILSLEEEGGLFVMYGKKIYPLVKDGKLVKNYLNYLSDSDSEEDQSYWKQKYEKEKERAIELKKLLKNTKHPHSRESTSSAAHFSPPRSTTRSHYQPQASTSNAVNEICVPEKKDIKPIPVAQPAVSSESIKIKFTTKNDQEIHLEGNWPQIHNVLEHVVHIFHQDPQPVSDNRPKAVVEPPSSGTSTPLIITNIPDPDVREKVDKIENEIFKEIEERDKEERSEPIVLENNVTKRKAGRPRKSSQSSVAQSPAKKRKTSVQSVSKESETNIEITEQEVTEKGPEIKEKGPEIKEMEPEVKEKEPEIKEMEPEVKEKETEVKEDGKDTEVNGERKVETEKAIPNVVEVKRIKRQSRPVRRSLNDSQNNNDNKMQVQTRRTKRSISKTSLIEEDEQVRYMFPPKDANQTAKTATDKNTRQKTQKRKNATTKEPSSPDTVCSNSIESTQGYLDTDPSPLKLELRKKKKINSSEIKTKTMNHARRSNKISLYYDVGESSNSSLGDPVNKTDKNNTTLNSNEYKSESYQLLMPNSKAKFSQLDPIYESPRTNGVEYIKHIDSTAKNEVFSIQLTTASRHCGQGDSDFGSSSNISLPLSPELSVVENMSISKELLNSGESGPTLNEMQCNSLSTMPTSCDQYLISNIDVSFPLMQQACGLENSQLACNTAVGKPHNLVTDTLVKKIGTINITEPNVTDNLDIKLRDLFLESAKKLTALNQVSSMDVDESVVDVLKKTRNKKRCSTPRKKKETKSKKAPNVQTVVEEERVESLAKCGRQSCPPIIQTLVPELDEVINITNLTINENSKPKGRNKKDVIKVKILRPKSKKTPNNTVKSIKDNSSKRSVCTDSGINDTESSVFLRADDSVDLIHNHSETCLHANECIGDSVEFVEDSVKSLISLSDSMRSEDIPWQNQFDFGDAQDMPEFLAVNNQDVQSDPNRGDVDACETVYQSPINTDCSLITEDLSDEFPQPCPRQNKWYLLSEDETTYTNMAPPASVTSFGANLNQIFPVTCAVPDLSTITEMSGDDNSRRPTAQGTSADTFSSQSILD